MILNRMVSILALSALLATSFTPAIAGDTRADPPRIEQRGDRGADDKSVKWKLPKPTRGISCTSFSEGLLFVKLTNGTGTTIPAGTELTLYVDPGEKVMHVTLEYDWLPGATVNYGISADVDLEIVCSARVKTDRGPGLHYNTDGYEPFLPGDVDAVAKSDQRFTCQMVNGGVLLTNTGKTTIPADSHIRWYTDLYSTGAYTPHDIPPGGSIFVPLDYLPPQFQQRVGAECWPQGIDAPSP
jgi:hypothetical protein